MRVYYCLLLSLATMNCVSCTSVRWPKGVAVPENLYSYSSKSMYEALKANDFPGQVITDPIRRNASGTKLIVQDKGMRSYRSTYVFTDGTSDGLEIIEKPTSAYYYWVDDNGKPVGWVEEEDTETIILQDGSIIPRMPGSLGRRGFDESGRFYFRTINQTLFVYDTANQSKCVLTYPVSHRIDTFMNLGDRMLVIEYLEEWEDEEGRKCFGYMQRCSIFRMGDESTLEMIKQFIFPEPGLFVKDVDPWSSWILLSEFKDLTSSFFTGNHSYLFNSETRETIKLGPISPGKMYFLQRDILESDLLTPYKEANGVM